MFIYSKGRIGSDDALMGRENLKTRAQREAWPSATRSSSRVDKKERLSSIQAYKRLLAIARNSEVDVGRLSDLKATDLRSGHFLTAHSGIDAVLNNPNRTAISTESKEGDRVLRNEVRRLAEFLDASDACKLFRQLYTQPQEVNYYPGIPTMLDHVADLALERMATIDPEKTIQWLEDGAYNLNADRISYRVALGWAERSPQQSLEFLDHLKDAVKIDVSMIPWLIVADRGRKQIYQKYAEQDHLKALHSAENETSYYRILPTQLERGFPLKRFFRQKISYRLNSR